MKILMLTPYLPYPPADGGQVRSYNLIKRLSLHHDITLVCFTRNHNTEEQVVHMEKYCRKVLVFERGKAWTINNILRTGFSLFPFLVTIYNNPQIRPQLQQELAENNYDLIHAETFYVMPHLPPNSLPVVLVEQTIMSRVFRHYIETEKKWWLKPLLFIDVVKISFWERWFWKKASRLVAVSEEDAQIMSRFVPQLQPQVVPNGVGEAFESVTNRLHFSQTILYMGNYKWIQNWEAAQILAQQVFPLIKKSLPEAKLIIAGQFPTSQVKALANDRLDISIREISDRDEAGVVDSYLKAGLLVAPIYGPGGTRLKILAAMSSLVPVVTTPLGAEGYGAIDGQSILVGSTPQQMAQKAITILSDRRYYGQVARAAKHLVDSTLTWTPITRKLESIYQELVHVSS